MEHCKYCQAELEEGSTVCPGCGKDNADPIQEPENLTPDTDAVEAETVIAENAGAEAPEEEPAAEEKTEEENAQAPEAEAGEETAEQDHTDAPKPARKKSAGKVAAVVAGLVVLVAVVAAAVLWGMKDSGLQKLVANVKAQIEYRKAIPEDGNPDDETCKGSYSASDKKVLAAHDTVVATAGAYELTLGELQIYYWQEVNSFLNQYGSYAPYFGLDYTQPLDTQPCGIMEGRTWQQYFLSCALDSWRTNQAVSAQADAENYEMEQELTEYLAMIPANIQTQAISGGFASAEELLAYNVGAGATVDDYVKFMEVYYRGYSYFNHFYSNLTATEEEITEMFEQNEETFAQQGVTRDTKTVNVRHILIYPEGADSNTVRTETFPDEAWAAAEVTAQELLDQWLQGDQSEESFAALAEEHSGDLGSSANGGLYTDVHEGEMVEEFNAWCFDPERQVGDYGIVKTIFGYHIMFYSGETLQWPIYAENAVIEDKANTMIETATENLPITVYYDRILLAVVDLTHSG